jgi:hypothetical protein
VFTPSSAIHSAGRKCANRHFGLLELQFDRLAKSLFALPLPMRATSDRKQILKRDSTGTGGAAKLLKFVVKKHG